jgi:hypothetical protein
MEVFALLTVALLAGVAGIGYLRKISEYRRIKELEFLNYWKFWLYEDINREQKRLVTLSLCYKSLSRLRALGRPIESRCKQAAEQAKLRAALRAKHLQRYSELYSVASRAFTSLSRM